MTQHEPDASGPRPTDSPLPVGEFTFACSGCGRKLKATTAMAGRTVRCPECSFEQTVSPPMDLAGGLAPSAPSPAFEGPLPMAPASSAPAMPSAPTFASPTFASPTAGPISIPYSDLPPEHAAPQTPAPNYGYAPRPYSPAPAAAAPAATQAYVPATVAPANSGVHAETRELFEQIAAEVSKVFVGQKELIQGALVALFSNGHVLIESVPGLGKTLFVRTLGRTLGLDFGRIQFTADLMPSDITGAPMFDMKTQEFRFRPGPVFTQLLLADEINRSPAKTHAALLEIMQEFRVTVDGTSHELKRPFLVLATQNPIESEGTYNLPEAQLDRFMLKLVVDYPTEAEEARILDLHSRQVDLNEQLQNVKTVASPDKILETIRRNATVRVDERLLQYVNRAVRATRVWPQLYMGASPRAGLALMQGARTLAAFRGRDFAVPDDVIEIALPALRHRVTLTPEAEVEGFSVDDVLREALNSVEVPRM